MKNKPYFLFVKETKGEAKEESRRLLREAVAVFFENLGEKEEEVFYTPLGKPYFPSGKFFLSVTHTSSLFAAVFSPFPVGIDAEKKAVEKEGVALRFFSEFERTLPFSHVWTGKEAVSKIDGRGLSILSRIEVFRDRAIFEEKKYSLFYETAGEYLLAVALLSF